MSTITLRDAALLSNQVNYQSLIESSNNTHLDSYDDYRKAIKRVAVNNSAIQDYTHALGRSSIVHLRWLDTVFQGQYPPSLSIN